MTGLTIEGESVCARVYVCVDVPFRIRWRESNERVELQEGDWVRASSAFRAEEPGQGGGWGGGA